MAQRQNKQTRVKKVVLDFADLESFRTVIDWTQRARPYYTYFGRIVLEQMQRDTQRQLDALVLDLQRYPTASVPPIDWTSEKQRRYVMMLLRKQAIARGILNPKGKDLAYVRTGKLAQGWHAEATLKTEGRGSVLKVEVWNDATNEKNQYYARYVMGDAGLGVSQRSLSRYKKPQQRYHRKTGWTLSAEQIRAVVERIQQNVGNAVNEYIVNGLELG